MDILIIVIILAALFGIGILVSRSKQKPPSESAEAQDIEWRISAAKSRALEAEARLAEWRVLASKVEARARDATKKGVLRRIWKFLSEHLNFLVGGAYLYACFLGMLYARSYYQSFDIDIFKFAEPLDFLLVVFSKTNIVLGIVLGIVPAVVISIIVLSLLSFIRYLFFIRESIKHCIVLVCESIKRCILLVDKTFIASFHAALDEFKERLRTAWRTCAYSLDTTKDSRHEAREKCKSFFWRFLYRVVLTMLIFGSVYVPRYQGEREAHALVNDPQGKQEAQVSLISKIDTTLSYINSRLTNNSLTVWFFGKQSSKQKQYVRATLRDDVAQPKTYLPVPSRTVLLGTTSSFHFFYEKCENAPKTGNDSTDENKTLKKENAQQAENGANPKASLWNTLRNWVLGWRNVQEAEDGPGATGNGSKAEETQTAETVASAENGADTKTARGATGSTQAQANASKCEKGRPFIIPTENIASLEFNPQEVDNNIPGGLSAIADAIKNLRLTVEPPPVIVESPSVTVKPSITVKPPSVTVEAPITVLVPSDLTKPKVQSHCAFGWDKVVTIGPFRKEEHALLEKGEELASFVTQMKSHFENKTLQQLMLIGRSDVTPLCQRTLALYGSNSGLAQARAQWVLDELKERLPEQQKALDRTILLSAGPRYVRDDDTGPNRAKDRSVEVWACWTPKPKPQSVDSSTDSPETPQESATK